MQSLYKLKNKGFSLIEVLVATLVFSIGIVAVVSLQKTFFSNASSANAKSLAINLAQSKIEQLRVLDFANIDEGLNEQNVTGPYTFIRNWNYTSAYYNNGAYTACANDLCDLDGDGASDVDPDQKAITVTVSWTNSDNTTESVALNHVINQNPDAASGSLTGGFNAGGSGERPVVNYTSSEDPGIVAIGVGDNIKRETLIPTSDGDNKVKFTAYTYDSSGQLLRQEDFLTVACNCQFTTDDSAYTATAAHPELNATTFIDVVGTNVSKDKGCVTNGNNCVNNAEELCSLCCANHHDPGASVVDADDNAYCDPANGILDNCYDPFRSNDDYTNGKHNHYTNEGTIATSGEYIESCRLKRINSQWHVYQDWHLADLNAFPSSVLSSDTDEPIYAGYVKAVVDSILIDNSITTYYGQTPTTPATKPTAVKRTSENPVTLALNGQDNLTGRAIYIDYLQSTLLAAIKAKKNTTPQPDYLVDVPFYEVEVSNRAPRCASAETSYGGWCPPGGNEVKIGSGDFNTNNDNGLAPGQIEGIASTGDSSVNVSFSFRRSNSALMGLSVPVDVHSSATNSDKLRTIANVAVSVSSDESTTHPLTVTLTGATPDSGTLTVTPSTNSGSCTGSSVTYNCTVPNNESGSLSFSGLQGTDICTGTSSYTSSSSSQTASLTLTCTTSATTHILTVNLTASGGTPSGGVLIASPASSCTGSGVSYTCIENDSDSGIVGSLSYTDVANCSGSASYTASSVAHTYDLAVSCITTQAATICVIPPSGELISGGSLTASYTAGGTTSCTEIDECGLGNKGKLFNCSVQNGLNTFSYSGETISGNTTTSCTALSEVSITSDSTLNIECSPN